MEVAWYFINLDLAFQLTSFLFIELFLSRCKDLIRGALLSHLLECVDDALHLSICVELVLMESTLDVDLVHPSHIDHVEGEDRTRRLRQCEVNIEQELKKETNVNVSIIGGTTKIEI